jgi:hypothetical protein
MVQVRFGANTSEPEHVKGGSGEALTPNLFAAQEAGSGPFLPPTRQARCPVLARADMKVVQR